MQINPTFLVGKIQIIRIANDGKRHTVCRLEGWHERKIINRNDFCCLLHDQTTLVQSPTVLDRQTGTGPVYCDFGLPGFRKVDPKPSFLAVRATQSGLP